MKTTVDNETPIDKWIDAIPENPYDPCPCKCGKKWKFAVQEGIEEHEKRFLESCNFLLTSTE